MAEEKSKYVVLAPYITLRVPDASGGEVITGFYAGAPVPGNVNAEDLERHVRKDMVAEAGSDEAALLAVPAGTPIPGEPPNVPITQADMVSRTHQDRLARVREVAEAAKKSGGDPKAAGTDAGRHAPDDTKATARPRTADAKA
jgi:hypothetical protein